MCVPLCVCCWGRLRAPLAYAATVAAGATGGTFGARTTGLRPATACALHATHSAPVAAPALASGYQCSL